MKIIDKFKMALKGQRVIRKESGPIDDFPSLQGGDIDFILSEHALRKYDSIKYIGPGAEAAQAWKAERLGTGRNGESKTIKAKKKKKRDSIEDLMKKKERLLKEIENLEKR